MLVQDLFVAMMEIIGATTLDEVPEAPEMQKCLRHTNLMLDSWSGRRLLLQATVQEGFPLVAGQKDYTIGIGGNFNTAKPIAIETAFVRDSSNVDYDLVVMDQEVYDSLEDKLITSARPEGIYYDAGVSQQTVQTGTIKCYGIPDMTYTLFINSTKYLTEFVNLTDTVTFPPAYFRALAYNGAIAIWRPMGRRGMIPPDITTEARESLKVIENINHRLPVCRIDTPGTSGSASDSDTPNIMSGDWI
jgi:hypothetical protein